MPTADSVKAKLQGLIDTANATTGGSDTTLTEAVDRLIEGYGSGDGAALARSIVDRSITEYSDDEVTTIGQYAFYNCTALTSVSLPNAKTIGQCTFQNCGFTSVNFPNVTTVDHSGFYGCKSLKELNLPSATTVRNSVCQNCTALESISLPSATYVGWYTFQGCTSLTEVHLPKYTGTSTGGVFINCTSLTRAEFDVATTVSTQLFQGCTKLETVILRKSDSICTLANVSAFTNTPIESGTGYVYVPSELVEDYKVATNWVTYADQIRAIEDYPEITDKEEE